MLIDTHCHLDFADFDSERDELVTRAHQAGVKQMVTISTRVRKLDTLLALTERYPSVSARSARIRTMPATSWM